MHSNSNLNYFKYKINNSYYINLSLYYIIKLLFMLYCFLLRSCLLVLCNIYTLIKEGALISIFSFVAILTSYQSQIGHFDSCSTLILVSSWRPWFFLTLTIFGDVAQGCTMYLHLSCFITIGLLAKFYLFYWPSDTIWWKLTFDNR